MTLRVFLTASAERELGALPSDIRGRIVAKLESAASKPWHFLERLRGRGDYKLRIGDYRAIVSLDLRLQTVCVLRVGHRKDIYKDI